MACKQQTAVNRSYFNISQTLDIWLIILRCNHRIFAHSIGHLQTCPDMLKQVQTCSNMSIHVQTCPDMFRNA